MSGIQARFKDWAPRDHGEETPFDHMARMTSVGELKEGTKMYFNPVITSAAGFFIWAFVIWAATGQEEAVEDAEWMQGAITDTFRWLYLSSQNVWILILLYIFYNYYDLKLGKDDDEPEFSDVTYFAMLFSAGVATGLWYFTAEGMWHYDNGNSRWSDPMMWNDNNSAEHSLMIAFFHWGIHGWIPYVVVGAIISFMTYRRGFPMSMRFCIYPLIGEMCYGVIGDLIEVLSILCTVFGVCTSLGLGAVQINKGLVRLDRGTYHGIDRIGCSSPDQTVCEGFLGLQVGPSAQIWIILLITLFATGSVVAGLKSGIATLSKIAFGAALFIVLSVLVLDDTWYVLNSLVSALGYYIWYLPRISFHTDAWEELGVAADGRGAAPDDRGGQPGWMNAWTIFYWGWWVSWGPFVGTFLARISKGRKMGSFITWCLVVPAAWSCFFIGIFGATQIRITNQAISAGLDGTSAETTYGSLANKATVGWNKPNASGGTTWVPVGDEVTRLGVLYTEDVLFEHLQHYGGFEWSTFITVLTLLSIVLYFVTSSDSASFVVDMMAANGLEEPPTIQKIFWAFTEGAAAAALLASAGSESPDAALRAVKAMPIVLGLPYTILLWLMTQSLLIACAEEDGSLEKTRKNFSTFFFNMEAESWMSFVVPFMPLGKIAPKIWGGTDFYYTVRFGGAWAVIILFLALGFFDGAFAKMAIPLYFMLACGVASLRAGVREKLGITGSFIADVISSLFLFPWIIGQMAVENFEDVVAPDGTEMKTVDNPAASLSKPLNQ